MRVCTRNMTSAHRHTHPYVYAPHCTRMHTPPHTHTNTHTPHTHTHTHTHTHAQVDIGQGVKPPGYYVQRSIGLFPAPWPQESPELGQICRLFELLGMLVAKCIQDGRRVDLPLSRPLFKLMCSPAQETLPSPEHMETSPDMSIQQGGDNNTQGSNRNTDPSPSRQVSKQGGGEADLKEVELLGEEEITKDGSGKDEVILEELSVGEGVLDGPWFAGILNSEDLSAVNPYHGKFLAQLRKVVQQREAILQDESLTVEEREWRLAGVTLPGEQENLPGVRVEDLW